MLLSILRAMTREQFLTEINQYIEAHNLSAREFSKAATGDTGFVSRLRNGKANITWATMERVQDFMRKNKKRATA